MKLKVLVAYEDNLPGDVVEEGNAHKILDLLNTRRVEKQWDDAKLSRVERPKPVKATAKTKEKETP